VRAEHDRRQPARDPADDVLQPGVTGNRLEPALGKTPAQVGGQAPQTWCRASASAAAASNRSTRGVGTPSSFAGRKRAGTSGDA
jgi:hypothetical protein